MPAPEVRSPASATTPLSTSRPASAARPVLGTTPIPITTMSAGTAAPEEVITSSTRPPAPRSSLTDSPNRNCTPCSRWRSANISPSSVPIARFSAVGSGSTTVTSHPASRAAAVVSRPIQPAPTVTTRPPSRKAPASRSESPTVRRYSTPSRSAPGMVSRRRAGGQQEPGIPDALPGRGGGRPAGRVHRGDRHAEPQVHAVLGVPALLVHVDHGLVFLAEQVALGQRGPLVGPLGLAAEQD